MRGFGTKTRIVLVGVIALILCGYGWWYLAPGKPVVPDVEVGPDNGAFALRPGHWASDRARLPLFEPATGTWRVDGQSRLSVASLAGARGDWLVGPGHAVAVRLPAGADAAVMRRALAALAGEGLCYVALFTGDVAAGGDSKSVDVLQILSVSDGHGRAIACRNRTIAR